ncbi:glycosyltransferase family 25 protein [Terrihabitans rhizophilus]|uniref:Glycosyltransferase family 25 protein n=1 Tax=Terrihabitans rhizophilus TaxID=3092662 RepID=A0ABU4RU35_9HYPH|nr:glycosyltransferase family 25 protein [Terrihabitans sp. PJ23]MDX6807175.1 glycosyltransferase family 25 protein [Terrihabitans sp. PJ23]
MRASTELPPAFVITIDAADGPRRNSARAQLGALNWPLRFVDGERAGHPDHASLYSERLNSWLLKRPLTSGEIAAYASHRRAMREFLASGAPLGLILEDDFGILEPAFFPEQIRTAIAAPLSWDLLKLFDFSGRPARERYHAGEFDIINPASPTAGMVAYLITRKGAERFLSRKQIFRQIDEDTKHYWELGLRIYSLDPNPIIERGDLAGGSHLEEGRRMARSQRSLRRSVKGNILAIYRKSGHFWQRRRFGFEGASGTEASHGRRLP